MYVATYICIMQHDKNLLPVYPSVIKDGSNIIKIDKKNVGKLYQSIYMYIYYHNIRT